MTTPALTVTYAEGLTDSLPQGFSQYRDALKVTEGSVDEDPEEEKGKAFSQKFEDIKEIRKDGIFQRVGKSHSGLKSEEHRRGLFSDESLLLRRIEDRTPHGQINTFQLEIQSTKLRETFGNLSKGITSIKLYHNPIVIKKPYQEIYYTRKSIQKAWEDAEEGELRTELRLLIDFQKHHMGETLKTIQDFKTSRKIDFEWLWALFPPREPVVVENKTAATESIYWFATLKRFTIHESPTEGRKWSITITHTGFNGANLGSVETSFTFPAFPGVIPIHELPIYPREFCDSFSTLRGAAIERGKRFEDFCFASARWKDEKPIGTAQEHAGPIWTEKEQNADDRKGCRMFDRPSGTVKGRAVVDFEGFFRESPEFRETIIDEENNEEASDSDTDDDSLHLFPFRRPKRAGTGFTDRRPIPSAGNLSVDEYLTCPPLVPIFSFANREWGLGYIDDLSDIIPKANAFDQLQLPTKEKTVIGSLVQGFMSQGALFEDLVQGKGQGLVLLLYGPPGCGKTMTAESISESLGKPLYYLSGGQLGSTIESVEDALEEAFELAARWDTILLLDEADSFMAKRTGADIERNSLIAVFLRLLEYQPGIVFLTTNREGDIDDAFSSRIHLQVGFSALGPKLRQGIWDRLARKNGDCVLSDGQLAELGNKNFNGRQIKNILRMAFLFAANRARLRDAEAPGTPTTESSFSSPSRGGQEQRSGSGVKMTFEDIENVLPLAVSKIGQTPMQTDLGEV